VPESNVKKIKYFYYLEPNLKDCFCVVIGIAIIKVMAMREAVEE